MIDFIYVEFLTFSLILRKRNNYLIRMITHQQKKDLPFDEAGYQLIEYDDFFFTDKKKKIKINELGQKFVLINSYFFEYLKGFNIPCSFVKRTGKNTLLFIKSTDFTFKVKILNAADKRIAKIFSLKQGAALELPVFEYHYGNQAGSVISESHIISFNLCSYDDLKLINRVCSKVNAIIKSFFERRNESIVELTCGFGKFEGKIYLVDDFSPLSLKIIKNSNNEHLPDPYKLETASQMKKYTDHLLNLTNG